MTKPLEGLARQLWAPCFSVQHSTVAKLIIAAFSVLSFEYAPAQTAMIDSVINATSLKQVVEVLASDSLKGRFTGTPEAQTAASFIAEEFKKAGVGPPAGNHGYFMPFRDSGEQLTLGINVIAELKGSGKPDELVIFCAHYDHVGTKSTNPFNLQRGGRSIRRGDTIYNGANDNASGISALIHLARYFAQLKNNERSVVFIAFSGEELGLKGSLNMISLFRPEQVIAVVNIEMIGRPISKKRRKPFITGSNLSNFRKLLNKKLHESDSELYSKKFFIPDPFPEAKLFTRSDNYSFAQKGIPAHTIMGCGADDPYYHSPGDETSTLDFILMETVVKAIAISTTIFLDGTSTPSRLKPQQIDP